jgi:two-component system C4-dicarboxylate transport sensor histidine kinase DctB
MLTDLQPLAPIRAAYLGSARLAIATFAVGLMLFLALGLWIRERADYAAETRQELERRVLERTEALEKAQAHFRSAREELAHANRLGSIGQITAAVAHEINQPVGAIRAFAENAAEFFRRGDSATGAANLAQIIALTDRIGRITAELRNYARRGSGGVSAVTLDTAIEGALMLTGHVLRQHGVSIRREGQTGLRVRADRIRLEQILVNLIQNAIEAMGQIDGPEIRLVVSSASPMALITIADNGPGVAADVADMVFAAFTTTKPNGLGLGLGIARDIAREFGGDLELVEGSGGGAHFHLALRLA